MDDEKKEKKPPHALKIGSTELSWGTILAAAFLIAFVLAAIRNLIVYLADRLLGVAVPAWEALLLMLRWLGFLLLAGVLILALTGVAELLLRAWRNRLRQEESVQVSPLPRVTTIRGKPPRSELERALSVPVLNYLLEVLRRDPSTLMDVELAQLRLMLPELFRRPEYAAHFNAVVVVPAYELLQADCPELEKQIQRYGQIRRRRPFWLLLRTLHIITHGAIGLSTRQVWQGPRIDLLKADFSEFKTWFWRHGWPLLGMLERLLHGKVAGSASSSELATASPPPSPLEPTSYLEPTPPDDSKLKPEVDVYEAPPKQESSRNPEAARQIAKSAEAAINSPEPWIDPVRHIDALEEAADEALMQDPESPEARRLFEQVRDLRARHPGFDNWFDAAIARDSSDWSLLLNEAYRVSAGDLSLERVKGQAARLYLTRPLEPEESWISPEPDAQTVPASIPGEDSVTPVSAEVTCEYAAPRRETDRPHLTVVASIEPSAAERAETLF